MCVTQGCVGGWTGLATSKAAYTSSNGVICFSFLGGSKRFTPPGAQRGAHQKNKKNSTFTYIRVSVFVLRTIYDVHLITLNERIYKNNLYDRHLHRSPGTSSRTCTDREYTSCAMYVLVGLSRGSEPEV